MSEERAKSDVKLELLEAIVCLSVVLDMFGWSVIDVGVQGVNSYTVQGTVDHQIRC